MKSKNPQAFLLRWIGASALHAIAFTALWGSNAWLFANWYYFIPFNFISGVVLAILQYWAMPVMMRPNAKRWFSASILGYALGVSLHTINYYLTFPPPNFVAIAVTLFLAPAVALSWALSERFRNAWIFGLAFFVPSLISGLLQNLPLPYYQGELVFHLLRTLTLGASLDYLQKYQFKEESKFKSREGLETKETEEGSEQIKEADAAEQKLRSSTKY